jgi:hypothetical protein
MKKLFFVFIFVLSFMVALSAQTSNPLAANNAFTFADTLSNPLKKFNMSLPYTLVSINTANTYFKQSLEFGAPGYLYYLTWNPSYNNYLYRIDTATGAVTQITTTSFYLPSNMNFGMSWDKTNNTMYTIFGGASLYSVNVYTGTFTSVCTITPSAHIVGFAVNNSGSMFGINTLGSKLVKINKTTGICTEIGSLSFPSGDVSGCDFDPLTNKMYVLSQNGSITEVYTVDTANATKTLKGTVPQKITELAIAGNTFVGIHQVGTEVPAEFKLMQNYPNPFNPVTKIKFQIAKTEFVNITVYDMLGREAAVLVNEKLLPGNYDVDWNARHGGSSTFPSGVYIYRMISGNFIETKSMILVK